jgi:hypothetical protein
MPRRQRRRYYNPWGQGGYEFDKWLLNLAPAEGQNAYEAQDAYNAYARSEAGMQGGAQNNSEAGLQSAFQNMLSPEWEAERDNAQAAIEEAGQRQAQDLNGPSGRPLADETLDFLLLPRVKQGYRKFKELIIFTRDSLNGAQREFPSIEKYVYEYHKYEKWMWASIKSNYSSAANNMGYSWSNMLEVYQYYAAKGQGSLTAKRLGLLAQVRSEFTMNIPAPYTRSNLINFALVDRNVSVTIKIANMTGTPMQIDVFQTNINGFNYNLANRIAQFNVANGNQSVTFNYNPNLGNFFTFGIVAAVSPNGYSIDYNQASYVEMNETNIFHPIYFYPYGISVEKANFKDKNITDLIEDFYRERWNPNQ